MDKPKTKRGVSGKANHGYKHGMKGTKTYRTWISMKERCLNKNRPEARHYSERGITICSQWVNSFENFFKDMGIAPPGYSLDRIDNDGNYEPSNCRWATVAQQAQNRRTTKLSHSIAEQIRFLVVWYGAEYREVAKMLGTDSATVSNIVNNKIWKRVND